MSQNVAAIRKEPLEMTQEQAEQEMLEQFAHSYASLTKRINSAHRAAQKIQFKPHTIKKARKTIKRLNANAYTISELIDTTADALDAPSTSPEYRANLLQGIESLEAKQEIVKNIQKDLNKSERCGANELEKITKEKDLWTNAFMGGIFAMYGIAATMTTASSGQSLCLSVLTSVTGFTMYAAAKAIIVNQESEMLEDRVNEGTYRCNSGPQRPGSAEAVQMIYDNTKQKIRKHLRLGD